MFNMDATSLFLSLIFSSLGIGYYMYGKKRSMYFRLAGVVLLIYPYFTTTITMLVSIGLLFLLIPFLLERYYPL